ncbi:MULTISPECIES: efflux RND transporter periplasmic adaptor subunit [Ralstonia solanacearum species complex]|uniref:efflux RND transporter periplasmic adaptor subunit n=1 Tax=Ralstonia solanacearum species complex TaxID=3116862 RepID=UPI001F091916|nr:efflux RND transporter periplasmic adaptor subunit [Ralstonia solanacearum]BEU72290.1 hypothetical protein MAFF211271_18450 [Ralstonia pseudosolanacearum]
MTDHRHASRRKGVLLAILSSVLAGIPALGDAQTTTALVRVVPAHRAEIARPVPAYGIVSSAGASVQSVSLPYLARLVRLRLNPGQAVKKGDALFDVMADPSAVLAHDQALNAAALARRELARTQALFASQLATQSQLDTARKTLRDAEQAAEAQQRLGAAGGTHTVTASFDGVVMQLNASPGDQISAGAPIALLSRHTVDTRAANVLLNVDPAQVGVLRAGDAVTLRPLAANVSAAGAPGRVVSVGAAIDPTTQSVVVAAFVPLDAQMLPGTRVAATIQADKGEHWVLPRASVLRDAGGAYVFQVDAHQHAHRVAVVPRVEAGAQYGVDGPLTPGAPVVSVGNYELTEGMAVTIDGAHS